MSLNPGSARLHYATVAMIELAANYRRGELLCVRDIADAHDIPLPFLTQILHQLRSHGLVQSVRGAAGGYRLAREPESITLADIAAVWGCGGEGEAKPEGSEVARVSCEIWQAAYEQSQRHLQTIRLDALADRVSGTEAMFHI